MSDDENIFKSFYKEVSQQEKVSSMAKSIHKPINAFISKANALVDKTMAVEEKRETKHETIITMLMGGLAFILANVYFVATHNYNLGLAKEEFEESFVNMFRTALANSEGKREDKEDRG